MSEGTADTTAGKTGKATAWIAGGVVVGIVLLCSGVFTDDDQGADEVDRWDAERVCKDDFIAKRLKAPASADYHLDVTGGPTTYTVSGTVDAENSFGASLRSSVTCVVTLSGDRWHLDSLSGLD